MSDITSYIFQSTQFRLDGGAMFGIIPKPLWEKIAVPDELNRINLALRLWALTMTVEGKDRLIVIDTGIGDYHDEKFNQRFDIHGPDSPLQQCLKSLGKKAEDVTDLIISHLHFDHVGGIGQMLDGKWQPVFPKAKLYLHQAHFEYAHNPTQRDSGSFHCQNFDPIIDYYKSQQQLVWCEGSEGILINHPTNPLRFKCSYGHTPHLMHPFNNEYIYLADLIPTSHHVHIPWVMGYDIAPGQTTIDKEQFLNFILEKKLTIIYEHDPEFWGGTIQRDAKGRITVAENFVAQSTESVVNISLI